jgi:hypothetical protein
MIQMREMRRREIGLNRRYGSYMGEMAREIYTSSRRLAERIEHPKLSSS